MKIRRAQYVTMLWTRATTNYPADGLLPTYYGWSVKDNILKPNWFEGPTVPDALFGDNNQQNIEVDEEEINEVDTAGVCEDNTISAVNVMNESDSEEWSGDSDPDEDEDDDD